MTAAAEIQSEPLLRTPLHALHLEHGARMVPFAGYEMPVRYDLGVLGEHKHTREAAGLFDVSHMGQAWLIGADVATNVETLVPGEIAGLKEGRIRYTQLTNDEGGILDDLMITKMPPREGPAGAESEALFIVVNAACKEQDFGIIERLAGETVSFTREDGRALLALQGPQAADVLARLIPEVATMPFMSAREIAHDGLALIVSRCGYTGEDGYEISVPAADADAFARTLLSHDEVELIGLGARDSLRLEAGLCLYGNDIDTTTTPVEANLVWSISKRRREEGGFPGADVVQAQLRDGAPRLRVGIQPESKAPAREGTEIRAKDGTLIGTITSGGFGPTHDGPVAMGYVDAAHAATGTEVDLIQRGTAKPAHVADMPFVPQRYYRAKA